VSTAAAVPTAADEAPILVELRVRHDTTDDPVERAALRIRQALYLARTSRLPEAEALPDELRAHWQTRGDGPQALRVFTWLWVLEGVLDFYRTSRSTGRQRLLLAHAAAERAGWRAERELAAAWLAHLAYVDNDYPGLLRWLPASGLGTATLDESVSRSSQTLACALQWFGQADSAARWFVRARDVARRTGDRAGITAATANGVMLRLHDNWLAFCFDEPAVHDTETLRQELQAILGYELLSGSASLQEQNEVARLRLAVLRGDDVQAHAQLSQMAAARQRRSAGALTMAAVVAAWIEGRQGTPALAVVALHRAEAALAAAGPQDLDDDDRGACLALMAQLGRRAGDAAGAGRLTENARAARDRVRAALQPYQDDLRALEADASANWPAA
jgi:hypothetical protein